MDKEKVVVIDFGGQYNQLVARRVRECSVYCEICSYKTPIEKIREMEPKGIILTGGPNSVYEEGAPSAGKELFEIGVPILGLCYGAQLMSQVLGGEVKRANAREYGKTRTLINRNSRLFEGVGDSIDPRESYSDVLSDKERANKSFDEKDTLVTQVWMSHFDYISKLAPGFETVAYTENCPVAAAEDEDRKLYAIQFHPEVLHTLEGTRILYNYVRNICGCNGSWRMDAFVDSTVKSLREKIGDGKVLLALSGGVDSSVAAVLMHRAVGENLTCIFVDHGLLRKNEGDFVEQTFKGKFGLNVIRVNAQERFLNKLAGVTEPEKKRKIIGEEFIRVFEDESKKLGKIDILVQGTIYPDVIESGNKDSAVIKSHHNVGGLPDVISFEKIVEPLRSLFKDEVRQIGTSLKIPDELVWRQPFPGPGLAMRVIGEVTKEKLDILRDADAIFREEMANAHLEREADQYFAVLTDLRSVGVMGDFRTYGRTVALRAITTDDFMTAEWARLPYEVLGKASNRITNEVKGITRVVYDITSKPPATVEWE